jgi:hypothetical protein
MKSERNTDRDSRPDSFTYEKVFIIRIPVAATLIVLAMVLLTTAAFTVYHAYYEKTPFEKVSSSRVDGHSCRVKEFHDQASEAKLQIDVYCDKKLIKSERFAIDAVGESLYNIKWGWVRPINGEQYRTDSLTIWKCGIPPKALLEYSMSRDPVPISQRASVDAKSGDTK